MKLTALLVLVLPLALSSCSRPANRQASSEPSAAVTTAAVGDDGFPVDFVAPDDLSKSTLQIEQIAVLETIRADPRCQGSRLLTEPDPDRHFARCTHRKPTNYRIKEYLDRYVPTRTNEQRLYVCVRHDPFTEPGASVPSELQPYLEAAIPVVCHRELNDFDLRLKLGREYDAETKKAATQPGTLHK